jgi:rfaE bifunctional protein nucleotidyltransferase chain/domain
MPLPPNAKLKSVPELEALVRDVRAAGGTVVFANGCFDLIHVGHVRYLEGARALGDILVVGINSDASVERLKGKGRPLQPEMDRVEIVASMEAVDFVVVFESTTVDSLLQDIRPDVHAKGTDYTRETVPERATVLSYGGRVEIVGDPKHHSSRDLIQAIISKSVS